MNESIARGDGRVCVCTVCVCVSLSSEKCICFNKKQQIGEQLESWILAFVIEVNMYHISLRLRCEKRCGREDVITTTTRHCWYGTILPYITSVQQKSKQTNK